MWSYILCRVSQFVNDITYHEPTVITNKDVIRAYFKFKPILKNHGK